MEKRFLPISLLLLLAAASFTLAVTDTYATLSCEFSSPSRTITAKGTAYSNNAPTCGAMTLTATLPNATKVVYAAKNCSLGVHEFSIIAPVNGVYLLNATLTGSSATCSSAALFFESRPRLSELNPIFVVLSALVALAFLRHNPFTKGNKNRRYNSIDGCD